MNKKQFDLLPNFSYHGDFRPTRGNLKYMNFRVFECLQLLRNELPKKNYIKVLSTNKKSGHAKDSYHYKGMAVDVYCPLKYITQQRFVEIALDAGFNGIGVYKNSKGIISFHLDIRDRVKFWSGTKDETQISWDYGLLINL